jgi:hypothetical protein
MIKRILLLLTVAGVLALMLVATAAASAFAANCVQPCGQTNTNIGETQNDLTGGKSAVNPSTNEGGDKGNTTNTGSKGQGRTRFGDQHN